MMNVTSKQTINSVSLCFHRGILSVIYCVCRLHTLFFSVSIHQYYKTEHNEYYSTFVDIETGLFSDNAVKLTKEAGNIIVSYYRLAVGLYTRSSAI